MRIDPLKRLSSPERLRDDVLVEFEDCCAKNHLPYSNLQILSVVVPTKDILGKVRRTCCIFHHPVRVYLESQTTFESFLCFFCATVLTLPFVALAYLLSFIVSPWYSINLCFRDSFVATDEQLVNLTRTAYIVFNEGVFIYKPAVEPFEFKTFFFWLKITRDQQRPEEKYLFLWKDIIQFRARRRKKSIGKQLKNVVLNGRQFVCPTELFDVMEQSRNNWSDNSLV
eukprot:snap_masked-scaffold_27-processed-gene-2.19-mRNA-1 protein AED:1.00 eAED:1.00 QI:0/-1/0/0/-1/1/1/0/225